MLKGPYIAILVAFLLLLLIRISVARRYEGFVADDENEGITAASMYNSSDESMDLARPPAGSMDLLNPPAAMAATTTRMEVAPSDTQSVLNMAASEMQAASANTGSKDSPQCAEWKKGKMAAAIAMSFEGAMEGNPQAAEMMKQMMNAPAPPGCS